MATRTVTTVAEYLKGLPADRRREIARVRRVIRAHLPKGYQEAIAFGMISYQVPLLRYPDTYNGQPLAYVALAAQKRFNTLYLMRPYADPAQLRYLERAFAKAGKRLDMGKSCIHFQTADDLPLPVIGELVASTTPDEWIATARAARTR